MASHRISVVFLCGLMFLKNNIVSAEYSCDEARCRAERIHPWVDNDVEYCCWVATPVVDEDATAEEILSTIEAFEENLADPSSGYCADGYIARIVRDVPQEEVDGEMRSWYTCCPPDHEDNYENLQTEVHQTCIDTCASPDWANGGNCWADGFQEPLVCGDTQYPHARFTGMQSLIYAQFICCDTPQQDDRFMDDLVIARGLWITFSSITVIVCTIFVMALYSDEKVRSDGYNLYLIFLAIPDALANFFIIIRNALPLAGSVVSPNVYIFVASFEYFYAVANIYLNAVIVGTIHKVLYVSNKDRKAKIPPPTTDKVKKQTAAIYVFALIVFGWAFYLYNQGLIVFNLSQIMNVWITTRCLIFGPPIFYVMYVYFDVWFNDRLPIKGRTRVLALYFLRVIVVFLCTWVPYFVLYEVSWNSVHSQWMVFCSYYLGSIQGALSVAVALSKPDVRICFWDFVYTMICCSKPPAPVPVKKSRPKRRKPARQENEEEEEPMEEAVVIPRETVSEDTDESVYEVPKRIFGGPTKHDAMWDEEDVWGGEVDILEQIMAGEIEPEFKPAELTPAKTYSFSDDQVSDHDT